MSILLSLAALPAIALLMQAISIDAGLWIGVAACAALIGGRRAASRPLPTALAFATGMLLTSLALVAA
jgi:O-antigen ligase